MTHWLMQHVGLKHYIIYNINLAGQDSGHIVLPNGPDNPLLKKPHRYPKHVQPRYYQYSTCASSVRASREEASIFNVGTVIGSAFKRLYSHSTSGALFSKQKLIILANFQESSLLHMYLSVEPRKLPTLE